MKQGTKKLLTTVGMSSTALLAGLTLNSQTSKAATQVSDNQVRVEAGDTYNSIAEANNVSIAELEQANGREVGGFDLIFPNEIVTLPSAVSNNSNTNDNNVNTNTNTVQSQETSSNGVSGQSNTNTQVNNQTAQASSYNGQVLSASAGRITNSYGNSETYYNLPENMVVANAKSAGLKGDYWVRGDGVKMFGNYVIVAANRSLYPYGSTMNTSLGTGISLDTGTAMMSNPNQLDIATIW